MATLNLDGARAHTTHPSNREAAVHLCGHVVQRVTRPWKQPSTRSSEPSHRTPKLAASQNKTRSKRKDILLFWCFIKSIDSYYCLELRNGSPNNILLTHQSRLHAPNMTPLKRCVLLTQYTAQIHPDLALIKTSRTETTINRLPHLSNFTNYDNFLFMFSNLDQNPYRSDFPQSHYMHLRDPG